MKRSTVHAVSCPDAAKKGKVCSHAVTTKMLLDWGIEVEIVTDHWKVPGPAFHTARHQAWVLGLVTICTLDPASTGRPWMTPRVQTPESIADALAFPTVSMVTA